MKKGKFIVVDGMDGAGKSVFLESLKNELKKDNQKIFDVNEFWEKNNRLPDFSEVENFEALYSSEPTYFGIGKFIREVLISKDSKINYSTSVLAQAYALDRQILYEGLILPFLKKGGLVFQSRSVSTSLVYQRITGRKDEIDFEEVLNLPGNQFALKNSPDFLIILTVDVQKTITRLANRTKNDNSIFEKATFQKKVKKEFESNWFKKMFEKRGTKVIYMDANKTIEYSKQQMIDFFKKELKFIKK